MTIHRAITLLNLILITLIAYLGVNLFYRVIDTHAPAVGDFATSPPPETSQALAGSQPVEAYAVITERDLFHTKSGASNTPADQVDALGALAQTQLKLKLWGTVSGDPVKAYAVIEDLQMKQQDLFRVGDQIQDAKLKMILREKVVITVAGRDEVLNMEEVTAPTGDQTGAFDPEELQPETLPFAQMQGGADDAPPMEAPPAERTQKVSLNRNVIDSAMRDVSRLMTEVRITPHTAEGEASGLALSNIRPNSLFRRMGLRNGDILMGVDGQEVRSVEDAMRLYEGLRSSSELKVQINRRGQQRSIDYTIR